ncbi:MAG: AAA family ATPase, partial [Smithella sp.]
METSGQFLNTKFIFPTLPNNLVLRENLTRRLNEGSSKKLILVYAPAGYGKSTLVNAWLRSILDSNSQNKASWLSLSQQDDDPAIFFTYLIKSLQTIDRNIGNWALSLLHTPEIPFEAVSTSLINNLTAFKLPCYIVLDDYHWISHDIIHTGLTYLIDHLPPNAQIILISREAPPLPLYRLRVYDDLVELDQQDLKFSITETGSFLKDFMGLILNDELIQVIQNKTEGWVAGLQIAAL